jgi:hypothetical protein
VSTVVLAALLCLLLLLLLLCSVACASAVTDCQDQCGAHPVTLLTRSQTPMTRPIAAGARVTRRTPAGSRREGTVHA